MLILKSSAQLPFNRDGLVSPTYQTCEAQMINRYSHLRMLYLSGAVLIATSFLYLMFVMAAAPMTAPVVAQGADQPAAPSATFVLTLTAVADNTLYEDDEGDVSNGAGEFIFAGLVGGQNPPALRRGLVRFDLTQIPTGSTILSSTLKLFMSRTNVGAVDVAVHRVTQAWGEGASDAPGEEGGGTAAAPGDATWRHSFFITQTWTISGGDFITTASAVTSVGAQGQTYEWSSEALLADVQDWYATPASNFGWILLGDEDTRSAKRFNSRENTDEDTRPMLVVTYEGEPTAEEPDDQPEAASCQGLFCIFVSLVSTGND